MTANHTDGEAKVNPWLIAVAVIVPTFMEVLDTSIVSVCLPNIAGTLAASNTEATWVQTSYLISNAVVLPASAWFSSFFGRKKFLLACIAIFTVASALCGLAGSMGMLVFARVIQGAGGGALQPLSQAILLETFPPQKRGQAMAAYGFGVLLAPIVGPVLGGWVTDNYSWRWLFYMNLPIGLLGFWMVQKLVSDPDYIRNAKPGRIDAMGFGLLTIWLGAQQVVLDKGQDADWFGSEWIRWFTFAAAASFVAFVIWELRTRDPIADLRVFKDRNFAVGNILMSISAVLAYAPMTLLPLFLQGLMGYTSLLSGIAQIPRGLGNVVFMPIVGYIIGKLDDRKTIGVGFLIGGISCMMLGSLNLFFGPEKIFWPNFLQGAGITLSMVTLMTVSVGTLTKEQMGNATGLLALSRNLAASIGISMVTTMAQRGAQAHQAVLVKHLTPYNPVVQIGVQAGQAALAQHVGTAQAQHGALALLYEQLQQQSNLLASMDDFRFLAVLCFIALPLCVLMKRVIVKGPVMAH